MNIPVLVVASFLLGSAQVIITNAAQAAPPQFVPAPLLHKANGNQYVAQTLGTSTLGPPIGSLLFVVAAALPFGLDAASFMASAILLATLPRIRVQRAERASMRAEMSEGLGWLRRHKLLRALAFMLGMNTVLGGGVAQGPVADTRIEVQRREGAVAVDIRTAR